LVDDRRICSDCGKDKPISTFKVRGYKAHTSKRCELCRKAKRRANYVRYEVPRAKAKQKERKKTRKRSRHELKRVEIVYDPLDDLDERAGFPAGAKFTLEALALGLKYDTWTRGTVVKVRMGGKIEPELYIILRNQEGKLELCPTMLIKAVGKRVRIVEEGSRWKLTLVSPSYDLAKFQCTATSATRVLRPQK
jgi:hypothetical protein